MQLNIGDRVKPASAFNYGIYSGPESSDSRGTVTEIKEEYVLVQWDDGDVWDHSIFGADEDNNDYAVELVPAE